MTRVLIVEDEPDLAAVPLHGMLDDREAESRTAGAA